MSASTSASAPWLGDVGGVAAQRRERRAQLVRGVGDEAALGLARLLERGEHRVERLRELADLVARVRRGQPAGRVARVRRSRGRPAERRRSGRRARRVSSSGEPAREQRRGDGAHSSDERAQAVCGVARPPRCSSRRARRRRRPGPRRARRAARRRARIGSLPSSRVGVAGAAAARSRARLGGVRRAARAPPSDAERATMRPWRSTTCTSSVAPPTRPSSAPGAVSSAGAVALSRATCVGALRAARVASEALQLARRAAAATAMPSSDDREHDRRAAAASATRTRRLAGALTGSSTKPTPRTVWISGGSPSLRRR